MRQKVTVPGSVLNFSFGSGHFRRRNCQGVRSTHASWGDTLCELRDTLPELCKVAMRALAQPVGTALERGIGLPTASLWTLEEVNRPDVDRARKLVSVHLNVRLVSVHLNVRLLRKVLALGESHGVHRECPPNSESPTTYTQTSVLRAQFRLRK